MKKAIVLTFLFLFVTQININAQKVKWYRDFNKALEIAKTENKFLLVDFYTDWCKWCKVMDEETYSNSDVAVKMNKYFIAVKINPEKEGAVTFMGQNYSNQQFAQAAGVTGYPSTGLFASDGQFITNITGYLDIPKFDGMLSYLLNERYKSLSYEDYAIYVMVENEYNKSKDSADLNFVMGFFNHVVFKDLQKAKTFYQTAIKRDKNLAEAYAGLSQTYTQLGDVQKAASNLSTAKSKGYIESDDALMAKVGEIIQKLFS